MDTCVCVLVAPKISCWPTEAALGERDVRLTCTLDAQPSVTSLFWIIAANGTTLTDSSNNNNRQFVAQLHVRHTQLLLYRDS